MLFYAKQFTNGLRLGDVVSGFVTATPSQDEPITKSFVGYKVDVKLDPYLVVLTPCCSIERKTISVAPLIEAKRSTFFKNEKYKKNMILLNQPRLPREWRELGEDEITAESEDEEIYTNCSIFIYAGHPLLPKYNVKIPLGEKKFDVFEGEYYLIDFRNISKVNCACIAHEKEGKTNYSDMLMKMTSSKILELSIEARSDLRNKLAYYYLRIPEVDKIGKD
jgi:hypothetical protein